MEAPRPARRPATREHHGRTEVDPYAWLCDTSRSDPEVIAHLEAENAYVEEMLGHTKALQDELFEEIKGRVQETDLSVPERDGEHWYYARTVEGQQYPILCRAHAEPGETDPPDPDDPAVGPRETVLLDLNAEAAGEYFSLGVFDLCDTTDVLAWAADRNGSELHELRFREVSTGEELPDVVPDVYYSSAWSLDGRDVFYTRTDHAMRPHEIWRHRLGTDAADDVLVHHEDDERFFCEVGVTKDRGYVVIDIGSTITSEILVCPAGDIDHGFDVLVPRRQGTEAGVEHTDGRFFVLTNDDALDFRVAEVADRGPWGDPATWPDAVAHVPGVRIEDVDVLRDHLLVSERTEATTRLRVRRLSSGEEFLIDQPEEVSTVLPAANDDMDWPQLRFVYTSMVTPTTVFDLDLDSPDLDNAERSVRKVQPVLGGYDPDAYESRRLWAIAADGVRVPISIVHRRDRAPGGPTLLYGYGSYEISMDPGFSSARLSLLDRGWAFAVAHVRGGGEMGRGWYDDGKLAAKPNTFDDFVAAGAALVDDGVAGAGRLAIRGGSAGGLLVGAALNRAPEQWAAVVAEVPFVDALNSILDPSLPLTVIEWEEWGNPLESAEIHDVMAAYSPYENVPATALPPVLATTGLHDPRVGYWEPAKWVARLRDRTEGIDGAGPFLLKTELGAGHGGPSGRYDAWQDEALVFAFLLDVVGVG
ncbi:MAG: S9 family peptidase [Acidimicrobiales bacterium]|nr:S9 family peptidase [Acidimicrobiales bacterium]